MTIMENFIKTTTGTSTNSSTTIHQNTTYAFQKQQKMLLPSTFQPSLYTVVIAKGAKARNAMGNLQLQTIVQRQLSTYEKATSRKDRMTIVSNILYAV